MGSASPDATHYDVLIIGGGIAGINCAYRLQTQAPHAKFAVLEARDSIGGTWNLFKYPGIRSDSDLHTYGFAWEPWPYETPIAEGHLILSYLNTCVAKYNLEQYIQLQHRVERCDWSSETKTWTVCVDDRSESENNGEGRKKVYEASFVVLATGYYDYDNPLPAEIPGLDNFQGKVVHPQFWPTDYDFADKEVIVIGSGATAITLIPNMASTAKHVTMLQRSPSYIHAIANRSPADNWRLSFLLPNKLKLWLNWLYFAIIPFYQVSISLKYPELAKKAIVKHMADQLPAEVSTDPHFTPRYNPWQQRLCLTPGGDFFKCLHSSEDGKPAKAGVVTAKIDTVTEDGILCEGGQKLKADVIVTATGLKMLFGGGIPFYKDGERIDPAQHIMWEGCMLNDVPNLMHMLGYAWASWTVGVDDSAILLCRLWNDMQKRGQKVAVPVYSGRLEEEEKGSWMALTSTYVKKSSFPTNLTHAQGPWKARGNVWVDWLHARFGSVHRSLEVS